jgi:5'(3')-deoxyribonucleotidase
MNKEFNAGFTQDDVVEWDLSVLLDPIIGRSWWEWMRERDWLWPNFGAIDGAIGGLEKLRRDGHYLECVTSKPQWAEASVWKWMGKWRPPFNAVTIVDLDVRKVDVTDASILIDDKPSNCYAFADEGRYAILYTRPHNVSTVRFENKHPWAVERVHDWRETVERVRKLDEED